MKPTMQYKDTVREFVSYDSLCEGDGFLMGQAKDLRFKLGNRQYLYIGTHGHPIVYDISSNRQVLNSTELHRAKVTITYGPEQEC